jgi:hypothetical protein
MCQLSHLTTGILNSESNTVSKKELLPFKIKLSPEGLLKNKHL